MEKIDYGTDAPKVIRNLYIGGLGMIIITFISIIFKTFFPAKFTDTFYLTDMVFISVGLTLTMEAYMMQKYSSTGKFKHRDRMLDLYQWQGDEVTLDVGTGLGLLMIGAAKKLTTGKSYGIDIWNSKDLSNNSKQQAEANAALEGVGDKIEILDQNIIKTDFPDDHFDVILSNLCLHNISKEADREKACREIFRILKPGGTAIISDFKKTDFYSNIFRQLGMKTKKYGSFWQDTFPPLTIIKAEKIKD